MKKKEAVYNTSYSYDNYAEQEDSYALSQYGVRIKNRAGKKPGNQKFTDKRERNDLRD